MSGSPPPTGPPVSPRPNEPFELILAERTALADQYIVAASFGSILTLYWICMSHLLSKRNGVKNGSKWLIAYISVLFFLAAYDYAGDIVTIIQAFVDNRDFPGGPRVYLASVYGTAIFVTGNIAFLIQIWMSDALLIYRLWVVYSGSFLVLIMPALLWVASVALGLVFLVQTSQPNSSVWSKVGINFGTPFFSLSIALNVLVPVLIVTRLLLFRRRIRDVMGPEHVKQYASISAMLVESAALAAISSLLFIIPYARGSVIATVFQGFTSSAQVISCLLIILRVAQGRAITRETASTGGITTMKYAPGRRPTSTNHNASQKESYVNNVYPLTSISHQPTRSKMDTERSSTVGSMRDDEYAY